MQLQFAITNQSLPTLIDHFIANSKPSQKTVLLNSILLEISQVPVQKALQEVFTCSKQVMEMNGSNSVAQKECRKNVIELMREIIKKYPNSFTHSNYLQIFKIVEFTLESVFCAVVGNEAIALLNQILSNRSNKQMQTHYHQLLSLLEQKLLLNNKMICTSYRQTTRNHLYTIIKQILTHNKKSFTKQYIEKLINLIEDEKDPRNIYTVFEIYQLILSRATQDLLVAMREKLFDCLEIYYPIDFEGDTEKYGINLKMISYLLDCCLAHQLFEKKTFELLEMKMGAPPISKHINLLLLWVRNLKDKHRLNQSHLQFLSNLLLRISEEEYLLEDYSDSQIGLPQLVCKLLTYVFPSRQEPAIPTKLYQSLKGWLDRLLVKQIYENEHNSKYAGVTIQIIQEMGKESIPEVVSKLVGEFAVLEFLKIAKKSDILGEMVYKLGMLVPIFEGTSYIQGNGIMSDIQKIGLLVLSLSQIFHATDFQEQQPKLLILKLFMLINNLPNKSFQKIIEHTNIIHSVFEFFQDKHKEIKNNRTIIIKSYIDFIVETYALNSKYSQKIHDSLYGIVDRNAQIYGLATFVLKVGTHEVVDISKAIDWMSRSQNRRELMGVLKSIKIDSCVQLMWMIEDGGQDKIDSFQLESIVMQKHRKMKDEEESEAVEEIIRGKVFGNSLPSIFVLYVLRKIWRPLLLTQTFKKKIQNILTSSQQLNLNFTIRTVAFYHASTSSYKLPSLPILPLQQRLNPQYLSERCCLLPIDPQIHNPTNSILLKTLKSTPKLFSPTIITHMWSLCLTQSSVQSQQMQTLLIPYLPTFYLKIHSDFILSKILFNDEGIISLSKGMIQSLSCQSLVNHVVPYCLQLLYKFTSSTAVDYVLSLMKVLYSLKDRCEQVKEAEEEWREVLRSELIKGKGKILLGIEQKFLQHRKRPARQSSRHVFSAYNILK